MKILSNNEIILYIKDIRTIIRLSLAQRDTLIYFLLNNQDFQFHKIFYKDLEEYFVKNRKNISPHITRLKELKIIDIKYESSLNKNGRITPNIMFIRLCTLHEIKEIHKDKITKYRETV